MITDTSAQQMQAGWIDAILRDRRAGMSAGPPGPRRPWFYLGRRASPPRILGLLAFHNEMRYLPDYLENISPHVDGIIALDDRSTDGSGEFVARSPNVLELVRVPPEDQHQWDERMNRRVLVQTALRHHPDWLIAVDADERLERDFRQRALREIRRAERRGYAAYAVILRELWGRPDTYRVDGIWGAKRIARFFKARRDHEFDPRPLHGHWAPLNSKHRGGFPGADLIIYHLRMIHEDDRRARRARYQRLDPDRQWQSIGYDYLTDENGLRLEELLPGREYTPLTEHG
jgi:glycosyltransferase involved in cell wall biosynthesis